MNWQALGYTCTGGHLYNAISGTKEEIERLMVGNHAIIITYGSRMSNNYSISRLMQELEKNKAPDLRAIYLGPWTAGSSFWMLRRGPEIPNERNNYVE